jgi:hypothetical protein
MVIVPLFPIYALPMPAAGGVGVAVGVVVGVDVAATVVDDPPSRHELSK